MNAEELYEAMKQALDFLGLRWGDMNAMQVSLRDKKLVFSYEGKEIAIPLPEQGERP